MSGLPPEILAEFSDDAIVRSNALLALRRVQIAGEHDGWISALVRDNGVPCAVLLRNIGNASSRKVQLFCSCEDAEASNDRCRHVLSLLVRSWETGLLRLPGAPAALTTFPPGAGREHARSLATTELLVAGLLDDPSDFEVLSGEPPPEVKVATMRSRATVAAPSSDDPLLALDLAWRRSLLEMDRGPGPAAPASSLSAPVRLHYRLHAGASAYGDHDLMVELLTFEEDPDGLPRARAAFEPKQSQITRLAQEDAELALAIVGFATGPSYRSRNFFDLSGGLERVIVERMLRTGRASIAEVHSPSATTWVPMLPTKRGELLLPARWDDGDPWRGALLVGPSKWPACIEISFGVRRGEEKPPTALHVSERLILFRDHGAPAELGGTRRWTDQLRAGPIVVPDRSLDELLHALGQRNDLLPMIIDPAIAERLRIERISEGARPHLRVERADSGSKALAASAGLRVGSLLFPLGGAESTRIDAVTRRIAVRDWAAERTAVDDLSAVGVSRARGGEPGAYRLDKRSIVPVVRALGERGWTVEADGSVLRSSGAFKGKVRWGIDWFDLEGHVQFGDVEVPLSAVFEAIRARRNVVTLADGSVGLLSEELLAKLGLVAKVGQVRDGAVRFAPAQALLLEAALGGAEIDVDAEYARVREGIQRFTAIEPAAPSVGFTGTLRPYQCEGLGWMRFLRDVGLGGCLADDMGLGKTVQVLAMLEARREERAAAAPRAGAARRVKSTKAASGPDSKPAAAASIASPRTSLVVAPRSLVFNWCAEAARFAPKLKVLDLSAPGRTIDAAEVAAHDLVLTTYGMLRNDFSQLREIEFDYLILDEAQAIKNASSQTAHAAKSLRGRHRLALSGTPVENHLGELWSLVEFLNPALLPRISERAGNALADPDAARVAAAAVRPFLLRRTKAQVAKDLPARIEKTITCQLGAVQRRIYDTLRNEVRASVQGRIKELGLGRAGVYVLEGLLRLRQAACHPGLVDAKWNGEPSAKLESLVPLLAELAAEGHKTLVFSQFTSFLDLVEPLVTAAGLRYERLDGSTRNRGERVERFQSDPSIPLFLISLKAGGLGLNLTSADHVVLLDPWWNPAVEAQAIDRAHRMGQHRTVIAARLVAADTVEARILELQARKRELADAIVGGERGPLSGLSREDLEHLLG